MPKMPTRKNPLGFNHKKLGPVALIFEPGVSLPGEREAAAMAGTHEYPAAVMIHPKGLGPVEFRGAVDGFVNLKGHTNKDIGVVLLGNTNWQEAGRAGSIPFIRRDREYRADKIFIHGPAVQGSTGEYAFRMATTPSINLHIGNVVGAVTPEARTERVLGLMRNFLKNNPNGRVVRRG